MLRAEWEQRVQYTEGYEEKTNSCFLTFTFGTCWWGERLGIGRLLKQLQAAEFTQTFPVPNQHFKY